MKAFIERILNEYVSAKQETFAGHQMGYFFRNEVPSEIYNTNIVDKNKYLITGSVGQGNWATIPWICIFDRSITTSATKGVYIVYLLKSDGSSLYLTFNQGCTEIRKIHNKRETISIMRDKAAEIASRIDSRGFNADEKIYLGNDLSDLGEMYQKGTIFYKEYKRGNVPNDDELKEDLAKMIAIYQEYANQSKHSVGQFDSWNIIDANTAVKTCDKSFFEYNGSGIPKEICWFFDADNLKLGETKNVSLVFNGEQYIGRIANESSDRRRVRLFWTSKLGSEFKALRTDSINQLRFNKVDNSYLLQFIGGENVTSKSTKDLVNQITQYISAKGFNYNDKLIENFYLSLKSKPFVILAGTSGTGKTRLVKLFAEAIGAKYKMISVRPDWSDGSDLFGHYDLNGNFIDGPICECFELAKSNPDTPVLLCLDEMNLARVEYYMSDFLSVIESREKLDDDKIITSSIAQYGEGIPDNIYIIGTVNMDETTFPFSKKVLDRANTIEFSYVDLLPSFNYIETKIDPVELKNSSLRTKYLVLTRDCADEQEYVSEICAELQSINMILQKANLHFGYRVRDEIVFYILNNKSEGYLITHNEAMDNEIMQKILPRIQGSAGFIRNMLVELFKLCALDLNQKTGESDSEKMNKILNDSSITCCYPKSAQKIELMMRRFEEDGFTSYWL